MSNRFNVTLPAIALVIFSGAASADASEHGHHLVSLDTCLHAAQAVRRGDFAKVEYLSVTPKGVPSYEIEIHDKSGKSWEMMCSAESGDVYEIETEVEHGNDPLFAKNAKISARQAIHIAQQRFGGTPAELEYEIEFDGSPTYEIDLNEPGQGDHQFKVEVDAVTGDIIELSVEQWQIGDEHDEDLNKQDESPNMDQDDRSGPNRTHPSASPRSG